MDATRIWIVIVDFNGIEDTRRCLQSIGQCQLEGFRTLVVDNGSASDSSLTFREEFPWCETLRLETNGGWAGGNNAGIRYALQHGADYVLLLNNDTIVAPQLIERLVRAADAHPGFEVLGPVINFMDEPEVVMTDGCVFNAPEQSGFFQRKEVSLEAADPPTITEVDIVNGCAIMIARQVFEQIGLIDERFFLIHEESDFCLRAAAAGFRCGVIGEALVWHKGSSSFKRTGNGWRRYYDARNLVLLLRKHAGSYTSRPRWRTWWEYFRYINWQYCTEREAGHHDAAVATIAGFSDGIAGRFGPMDSRRRECSMFVLRTALESWRRRPWRRA